MKTVAIIPAYNEASRIVAVIDEARPYVDTILVVDDCSTDETAQIAEKSGALVLRHVENCGAGAATMTGIMGARQMQAEIVITLDADGQHDPRDIPALLLPVKEDRADLVFGSRFTQRNRIPFIRRLYNGIGNCVTFAATGRWVSDSQCGFKVFGKRALREVDLRMSGFEFCTEIVRESVQHHWRIAEVPIKVLYSEYTLAKGQSFAHGVRTAAKILLRSLLR